jgi:hypothetical protein
MRAFGVVLMYMTRLYDLGSAGVNGRRSAPSVGEDQRVLGFGPAEEQRRTQLFG